MKNLILLFFLFSSASYCLAQIGVVGGVKTFHASEWNPAFQEQFNEEPYPLTGTQLGVDYWFRLKKRRIEFAPEITAAQFKQNFANSSIEHRQLGLHFNTAVYIFDLAGDCNCPTFSKEGNFFGKGFFLELSPGLTFLNNKRLNEVPNPETIAGNDWAFGGSIGAGIDLGFSDLFTITPIARYHIYPNIHWDADLQAINGDVDLTQLFLGLRLRLHIKEFSKARYR